MAYPPQPERRREEEDDDVMMIYMMMYYRRRTCESFFLVCGVVFLSVALFPIEAALLRKAYTTTAQ